MMWKRQVAYYNIPAIQSTTIQVFLMFTSPGALAARCASCWLPATHPAAYQSLALTNSYCVLTKSKSENHDLFIIPSHV